MIARLVCWLKGHKRGKRVSETHVACPRCNTPWERKKQAKAATA